MNAVGTSVGRSPRSRRAAGLLAILAALGLAACAGVPTTPTVAEGTSCEQLQARWVESESTRQEAQRQKQDAWKAIVPFAIAARHAQAEKAIEAAGQRQQALKVSAQRQGCPDAP